MDEPYEIWLHMLGIFHANQTSFCVWCTSEKGWGCYHKTSLSHQLKIFSPSQGVTIRNLNFNWPSGLGGDYVYRESYYGRRTHWHTTKRSSIIWIRLSFTDEIKSWHFGWRNFNTSCVFEKLVKKQCPLNTTLCMQKQMIVSYSLT